MSPRRRRRLTAAAATTTLAAAVAATLTVQAYGSATVSKTAAHPPTSTVENVLAHPLGVTHYGKRHAGPGGATKSRPNVLFITADDAAPSDLAYMPHLKHLLIDRGVDFTDAIAPTPICVPARASLLTGQYTHNHKAYTISGNGGGFDSFDSRKTLPTWLRTAGYDTLFIGKYLNGYGDADQTHIEPGWTQWRPTVGGSTYNFMHPILNINGTLHHYDEYNSTLFADQTKDLLTQPERKHKPWYMWVNYVAPHEGGPTEADDPQALYPHRPGVWLGTTHPDPADYGRFKHLQLPHTPNMFDSGTHERSAGAPMSPLKKRMTRDAFIQRIQALQSVDRAIAKTVGVLKRTHQYRNTILMFSSDNGFLTGQHNRNGKLVQFDQSERIPFVMAGPGVPVHKRLATPITNPDIATTIAAIAHAHPTRAVDGVNMMPWLDKGTRDRIIPVEAYPVHGGTKPIYTGIREGYFTYVHWTKDHHTWDELYDRSVDPWELHNVAKNPAYAGELARYRALDRQYRDCAGSTCPKAFLPPMRPTHLAKKTPAASAAPDPVTPAPAPVTPTPDPASPTSVSTAATLP